MSVTLYGIKNCDSVKKAKLWLNAAPVEYQFHDYRVDGIDKNLIDKLLSTHTWQALLNTRGTTWRHQSQEVKDTIDEERAIALMLEFPAMIKRPFLITPTTSLVGFKADQYQDIFAIK